MQPNYVMRYQEVENYADGYATENRIKQWSWGICLGSDEVCGEEQKSCGCDPGYYM